MTKRTLSRAYLAPNVIIGRTIRHRGEDKKVCRVVFRKNVSDTIILSKSGLEKFKKFLKKPVDKKNALCYYEQAVAEDSGNEP